MIFLIDIDGVLVENRAYRAALRQTIAYVCRRLGLGEAAFGEAEVDAFEANSVTVEWDSGAIAAAALVMQRLKADPVPPPAPASPRAQSTWEALDAWASRPVSIAPLDFAQIAQRVGEAALGGELPSRAALRAFTADLEAQLPPETARPAAQLISGLLARAYDVDCAPVMQVFQNYALGHEQYARYYQLEPLVEGEALLEKLDRPRLSLEMRGQLLQRRAAGEVFPAIYTARPTLAPAEVRGPLRGYTPEAEIARGLVGLDGVPVMGYGKLDWLAQRVGMTGADLVKPSPVEAIAAMAVARTGLEIEALKAALAVGRGDHLRHPVSACAGETVHVFEDSASSLRATARAADLLNRQGLGIRLVRHGIAPPASPKRAALEKATDFVHDSVNDALAAVWA